MDDLDDLFACFPPPASARTAVLNAEMQKITNALFVPGERVTLQRAVELAEFKRFSPLPADDPAQIRHWSAQDKIPSSRNLLLSDGKTTGRISDMRKRATLEVRAQREAERRKRLAAPKKQKASDNKLDKAVRRAFARDPLPALNPAQVAFWESQTNLPPSKRRLLCVGGKRTPVIAKI